MVMPAKAERALITQEEFELLAPTHYPTLPELADDAISAAQRRIRDLRAKERTLLHQMRRSIRGKSGVARRKFPRECRKTLSPQAGLRGSIEAAQPGSRAAPRPEGAGSLEGFGASGAHAQIRRSRLPSPLFFWPSEQYGDEAGQKRQAAYNGQSREDRQRLAGNESGSSGEGCARKLGWLGPIPSAQPHCPRGFAEKWKVAMAVNATTLPSPR
ncbi:MAG: hypothetical protein NVV74_24070 [Magnetospirillum sp.]|nr:hypothetical protein [Magnetospirillum sp.]